MRTRLWKQRKLLQRLSDFFLYFQIDKYITTDLNSSLEASVRNRNEKNNTKDDWDIVHNAVSGYFRQ